MKRKFLLFRLFALVAALSCTLGVNAYDFYKNGIYYNIWSDANKYVEVTNPNNYQASPYSGSVTIPNSVDYGGIRYQVVRIGAYAFYQSRNLTSVTISSTVTQIGENAFDNCSGLTSLTIPNSVGYIDYCAFFNCSNLATLTIGSNVRVIDDAVFWGCTSLSNITCLAVTPPNFESISDNIQIPFSDETYSEATLYVPKGCRQAYRNADWWGDFDNIQESPYDFNYNGIFYAITGSNTVEVTNNGGCNTYSGNISIPPTVPHDGKTYTVTRIGNSAFDNCRDLTSVTISSTVTQIGENAFDNCSGLTSLTIPNSVGYIDYCAFFNCSNLATLTIGSNVRVIDDAVFWGCTSLSNITCLAVTPPNFESISDNIQIPFSDETYSEATLYVPKGCRQAYRNADWWGDFDNIQESPYDFNYNGIFYAITGSNTVEVTNNGGCNTYSGIISIPPTVPHGSKTYTVTGIGEDAFWFSEYELGAALKSVSIPNTVTYIGNAAFANCSGLTSMTIPNSVLTIGNAAFFSCGGLTSLTIGNSVTTIGEDAFGGLHMTSLTIPASVTYIGDGAFSGNQYLETVTCLATTPPATGGGVFDQLLQGDFENDWTEATLYVPKGCKSVYQSAPEWEHFPDIQELPYSFQYNGIFYNITGSNTVEVTYNGSAGTYYGNISIPPTVPNGGKTYTVTAIGNYAFNNCANLTKVTIPNTVTVLGQVCFADCPLLWNVSFGNSVRTIGLDAFRRCTGLTSVTIPNSVTEIGYDAFSECSGLMSVNLGNSLTTICGGAFNSCSNLTSITIPNSVKTIGEAAFRGCSALTSVTCLASRPPTLANINVFDQTTYANATLTVPDNALSAYENSLGWNRFNKMTALPNDDFVVDGIYYRILSNNTVEVTYGTYGNTYSGDVTIPASVSNGGATYMVTAIGDYAFRSSTGLTSVSMPETVTRIGYRAFYRCDSSFRSVTLPNSLIIIDDEAFASTWLKGTLIVPNSVTTIGENAFGECSFTEITLGSGLVEIGMFAFDRNGYLRRVTCLALTPPLLPGFSYDLLEENVTLYVPYHSLAAYQANEDWARFGSIRQLTYDFMVNGLGYKITSMNTIEVSYCDHELSGEVIIPEVVYNYYIGDSAGDFAGSYSVTGIGEFAFYDMTLTGAVIPNTVIYIGDNAFGESDLSSVTIGNSVTSIGKYAFYLTPLTSVTIPNSVESIGLSAFEENWQLESVTIGSGVTTIGNYAFGYCSALTSVTCLATTPPNLAWENYNYNVFDQTTYANATLTVPANALRAYETTGGWNRFNKTVAMPIYDFVVDGIYYNITSDFSVEVTYGTYGNTYSGDVTIPASVSNDGATYLVTAIGDYAFRASTGLSSVSMPETVTRIGYRAFYRCDSSFRSVTLPNSLITIDDEAFASYHLQGTLIVPNSVTTIGENAFGGCSFTEIILGSGLVEIGMFAFDRNYDLRMVTCLALTPPLLHGFSYDWDEANATLYVPYHSLAAYQAEERWSHFGSIQQLAFDFEVEGLGYLFLENDAVEIATYDYRIISGDVVIPEEVTFMGTTYQITRIGDDAFYSCVGMLSVEIPNTVTTIGNNAFGECQYLASVTIPSSVTSIGDYAFIECYNLRDVTCLAITPPTLYGEETFEQNTYTSGILKVPAESVSDYQEAYVWSNFSRIIANAIPGDVNGDGILGIADVTTIIDSILSGNSDYNPVADFNGDGVVGIADVTAIIDSILGN